jgi:hypothetical protein
MCTSTWRSTERRLYRVSLQLLASLRAYSTRPSIVRPPYTSRDTTHTIRTRTEYIALYNKASPLRATTGHSKVTLSRCDRYKLRQACDRMRSTGLFGVMTCYVGAAGAFSSYPTSMQRLGGSHNSGKRAGSILAAL